MVLALAALLPDTGSAVELDTDAALVSVTAYAGAVTTTVIGGADEPAARVGLVQVTETLPEGVQDHPVPVAETIVTPAGRVSLTETLIASEGPALETPSE